MYVCSVSAAAATSPAHEANVDGSVISPGNHWRNDCQSVTPSAAVTCIIGRLNGKSHPNATGFASDVGRVAMNSRRPDKTASRSAVVSSNAGAGVHVSM
jgi:hypothetical protein